jgi:hypothetical protein
MGGKKVDWGRDAPGENYDVGKLKNTWWLFLLLFLTTITSYSYN